MKNTPAYLLLFALFTLPLCVNAQQNPVDSLKSVLKNTQIDTIKLNTLNELANLLRGRNNDQALRRYARKQKESGRSYYLMLRFI